MKIKYDDLVIETSGRDKKLALHRWKDLLLVAMSHDLSTKNHNKIIQTKIVVMPSDTSTTTEGGFRSVEMVIGYGVYVVTDSLSGYAKFRARSIYSQLTRRFLGGDSHMSSLLRYALPVDYWGCFSDFELDVGGPMPDDLVRHIEFARATLPLDTYLPPASFILDHGSAGLLQTRARQLRIATKIDDTMLALVSCIKKLRPDGYSLIMDRFDKLGPPSGTLGKALNHIDKFRSF